VGIEKSKIRSQHLADEALAILTSLDLETSNLESLTSYVVTRNH
jgi:geranylgeranyl pyrophosphate synthase